MSTGRGRLPARSALLRAAALAELPDPFAPESDVRSHQADSPRNVGRDEIRLVLPWPPTVNNVWQTIVKGPLAGRKFLSKTGKTFRENARLACLGKGQIIGRMRMRIDAYAPDNRLRDLDNILKASLDGMQHAGVFEDDNAIDDLHVVRAGVSKERPRLEVHIESLGEIQAGLL